MFPLVTRRSIIEPCELPDQHGKITCLEPLPGGRVRVWICQTHGSKPWAVSRVVLSAWDMIHIRPYIGQWLATHGYNGERPVIIH